MNRPNARSANAANAVVELDCPWCAEPVRGDRRRARRRARPARPASSIDVRTRRGTHRAARASADRRRLSSTGRRRARARSGRDSTKQRRSSRRAPMPRVDQRDAAAGRVDEQARRDEADRLEAERDRPGRPADPTDHLVGRGRRTERDVGDEHDRVDQPGDERRGRSSSRPGPIATTTTRASPRTTLPPSISRPARRSRQAGRDDRAEERAEAIGRQDQPEGRWHRVACSSMT